MGENKKKFLGRFDPLCSDWKTTVDITSTSIFSQPWKNYLKGWDAVKERGALCFLRDFVFLCSLLFPQYLLNFLAEISPFTLKYLCNIAYVLFFHPYNIVCLKLITKKKNYLPITDAIFGGHFSGCEHCQVFITFEVEFQK